MSNPDPLKPPARHWFRIVDGKPVPCRAEPDPHGDVGGLAFAVEQTGWPPAALIALHEAKFPVDRPPPSTGALFVGNGTIGHVVAALEEAGRPPIVARSLAAVLALHDVFAVLDETQRLLGTVGDHPGVDEDMEAAEAAMGKVASALDYCWDAMRSAQLDDAAAIVRRHRSAVRPRPTDAPTEENP